MLITNCLSGETAQMLLSPFRQQTTSDGDWLPLETGPEMYKAPVPRSAVSPSSQDCCQEKKRTDLLVERHIFLQQPHLMIPTQLEQTPHAHLLLQRLTMALV